MNKHYPIPLTHAEEMRKKPARLVRAAARIAVVAPHQDGLRCLFVRHQTKGLELPGGAIDPGEIPAQTALRELEEEAGVVLPIDLPLRLFSMQPILDHRGGNWLDIVYGTLANRTQLQELEEAELPVLWLNAEEIRAQVRPHYASYNVALMALDEFNLPTR